MTEDACRVMRLSLTVILALLIFAYPQSSYANYTEESAFSWVPIAAGIDYSLTSKVVAGRLKGIMLVVRIDPSLALFRIYYEAGQRKTIQQWAAEKPGAVVIVNASFFRGNGQPSGLLKIGNDVLSEASGRPNSAQFEVVGDLPSISLISQQAIVPLADQPGLYGESFEGYPLLIWNGQATPASMDNTDQARRTVIAQDNQGNILIVNTETVMTSLQDMTDWLLKSKLGISSALNLDGGTSSQIYVAADQLAATFKNGRGSVPVVLAVYPR
jgi:exopolysaccharide biosynthesis protein